MFNCWCSPKLKQILKFWLIHTLFTWVFCVYQWTNQLPNCHMAQLSKVNYECRPALPCSGVSLITGSSSSWVWLAAGFTGTVTVSVDFCCPESLGFAAVMANACCCCCCGGSCVTRGDRALGRVGFDLPLSTSAAPTDSATRSTVLSSS